MSEATAPRRHVLLISTGASHSVALLCKHRVPTSFFLVVALIRHIYVKIRLICYLNVTNFSAIWVLDHFLLSNVIHGTLGSST